MKDECIVWLPGVQQDLWIPVVKGASGTSAGCMEFCQTRLYHAGMMLACFPMEHEPIGKEIKSFLSSTPVLGGEG